MADDEITKWSSIPRAQAKRVGSTVLSEVKFYGITIGVLTTAIAIMILTIWIFYWVRKRSCANLIKGAAECAFAFYQNSINNTVLGLAGIIVICTFAVTGRLIYLHYETKLILKDLDTQLDYFDTYLAGYLNRAQQLITFLKSSGIDIDAQIGKGIDAIQKANELMTPEFIDEINKTVQSVKNFWGVLGPAEQTNAGEMLRQAQSIMDYVKPEMVNDLKANVASLQEFRSRLPDNLISEVNAYFNKQNMENVHAAINQVNEIRKQLEAPEFKVEYKKTIDMVKASLAAAKIGGGTTDPIAILKQAQQVLAFASPQNIGNIEMVRENVMSSWGLLDEKQKSQAITFIKSLNAGDATKFTPQEFDIMMRKVELLKQFADYTVTIPDKGVCGVAMDAGCYMASWFKTQLSKATWWNSSPKGQVPVVTG